MNLPSRGLRPSATTMRKTGKFFVPTRFMRILTAIINRVNKLRLTCHTLQGFAQKSVKPSLDRAGLQVLFFWQFFEAKNSDGRQRTETRNLGSESLRTQAVECLD